MVYRLNQTQFLSLAKAQRTLRKEIKNINMLLSLPSPRIAGPRLKEIGANVEALWGEKEACLFSPLKGTPH